MLKIYTGYAWREMKPEEIEILTPDRMVAEMTEDAAAGDVYDEQPYSKEELEAAKMQVTLDDWDEYQRYHDSRDFEAGDVYEEEAE